MKKWMILGCLTLLMACTNNDEVGNPESAEFDMKMTSDAPMVQEETQFNGEKLEIKSEKIIRDAHLTWQFENGVELKEARNTIEQRLRKHKGSIEFEHFEKGSIEVVEQLRIRIPSQFFTSYIHELEGADWKLIDRKIESENVSEEYYDLETRVKNKMLYVERYRELLAKARNVKEVIEIEEKIREIVEEVESNKTRMEYIDRHVAQSTLYIELKYDVKKELEEEPSFWNKLARSLSDGWSSLVHLILSLISSWPYLVILGLILYFALKRFRK